MKRLASASLLLCTFHCVAAPAAGPEATFDEYIRRTNTHNFDAVAPVVQKQAVYWFRDNEYSGIDAVRASFDATWAIVKDERYSVHDVRWLARTPDTAVVLYGYCWSGLVDGKPRSGGGRGTNVLLLDQGAWRVAHEHLSPYNTTQAAYCDLTSPYADGGSGPAATRDESAAEDTQ